MNHQGFQDFQAFCQQEMTELANRHQRLQQEVIQECRDIFGNYQQQLEVKVHGAVQH